MGSIREEASNFMAGLRREFSALETAVMDEVRGHPSQDKVGELLSTMKEKLEDTSIDSVVRASDSHDPRPVVVTGSRDPATNPLALENQTGDLAANSADSTDEPEPVTEGVAPGKDAATGGPQDPAIPDGPKVGD